MPKGKVFHLFQQGEGIRFGVQTSAIDVVLIRNCINNSAMPPVIETTVSE